MKLFFTISSIFLEILKRLLHNFFNECNFGIICSAMSVSSLNLLHYGVMPVSLSYFKENRYINIYYYYVSKGLKLWNLKKLN